MPPHHTASGEPRRDAPDATPCVVSVNVGGVREVEWRGQRVRTGIWKTPVVGRDVPVRGVNLEGDDQADRTVHGGADKAVYAYAAEDYEYWQRAEGVATTPGLFGENLTTRGLDLTRSLVGERWHVGSTVLEVAQPRLPCFKLGLRLDDARFPKRFLAALRLGAYLRIASPGAVRAGDPIVVVERPTHGVTLGLMAESLRDPALLERLRGAARLPARWQAPA